MKLNLYTIVSDIQRSAAFYRQVFDRTPIIDTSAYVAFDLDGALFGLFNAQTYPAPYTVGSQVVPNLLVADIDAEHARIAAMGPAFISEIRENPPYRLFVFADPDGTPIEFYAESRQG